MNLSLRETEKETLKNMLRILLIGTLALVKLVHGRGPCRCKPNQKDTTVLLMCSNVDQNFHINITDKAKTKSCSHFKPTIIVIHDSSIPVLGARFFGNIPFDQFDSVTLRSCGIRNIRHDTFANFTHLKSLGLQDNKLTEESLKIGLVGLKNITIINLFLGGNNITVIKNETFSSVSPYLSSLQLPECGIKHIEIGALRWFPKLKKINLNDNFLRRIDFLSLDNSSCTLHDIQLKDNLLDELHVFESTNPCFQNFKSLTLDGNPIKCLAPVNRLKSLKYLYVQRIPCTEEGPFPVFNVPLTGLYLGNNNVSCWRKDMLSKLGFLSTLSLKRTSLVKASADFLVQLFADIDVETLILQNTGLRDLPQNIFIKMASLKYLYLNNNSISSWSKNTFSGLHNLVKVSLHDNSIKVIEKNSLPTVNNSLDISNNPFLCTCALVDFCLYFENHLDRLLKGTFGSYECAMPLRWKGKELQTFRPEYTDCNPFNPYVIVAFCTCGVLITLAVVVNVVTVCLKKKDANTMTSQPPRRNSYQSLDENTDHDY